MPDGSDPRAVVNLVDMARDPPLVPSEKSASQERPPVTQVNSISVQFSLVDMTGSGAFVALAEAHAEETAAVDAAIASAIAALPPEPTSFVASRKPSTTARQSTIAFADDPAMAVSVNAGVNYTIRGVIWFTTSIAAGFKWQITGPAITSLQMSSYTQMPGTSGITPNPIDVAFSTSRTLVVASTAPGQIVFEINVVPSASGTVHLQWAQGVSDASDTSVLLGSYVEVL